MTAFEYEASPGCPICRPSRAAPAGRIEKHYAWGTATFVRCASCGSWRQSPQIASESLREWFDSPQYRGSSAASGIAYVNYIEDEPSRLAEAQGRYRNDLIADLPKGSKVLELGCATGSLLSVIRDHGCEVTGVDLSAAFVDAARRLHALDVELGDVHEIDLPVGAFDAIVLFGTLGNLKDPIRYFRRFRQLLKPSGVLVFNFVDADSPVARILYRSRFWMFTPSVSCFMTRRGCEQALAASGFTITDIRRDRQRPSLQKLFNHAGMRILLPVLKRLGLGTMSLPFSLPIPSVRFVKARREAETPPEIYLPKGT